MAFPSSRGDGHTLTWLLLASGLSACTSELDTKLSTELAQVRLTPFAWVDTSGKEVKSDTNPGTGSTCALRLRDTQTGKEYAIQRSHKIDGAAPGSGSEPTRATEYGDYLQYQPGTRPIHPTHLVRIECSTWKVLGIVRAGA